ncbi:hypothetical protein DPMN_138028 [Dreissena polymorpha]|uniref:C1q domain-containing protein n=1 Tax=Dreissena polymorpha TaxID=45954 RepID=A0A9D4G6J4_DREPO|nr:hypothetical protein DPMN_138028 [Dreissena polymorpha]
MGYVKWMVQLVIVFFLFGILKASEPMCLSRFDYDEKIMLKILKLEDALEKFEKNKTDNAAIAFTAHIFEGSPVLFSNVITNIGNLYNQNTGTFTSTVPVLYYFTFHLVKKQSYMSRDSYNGSYGVSNGAYLHLMRRDTVQLVQCSPSNWFESWSSFSGVLIKAN